MDSSALVRMAAQVALTTWAISTIVALVGTRKKLILQPATGIHWAVLGLSSFAAWTFLSSISINATAAVPRGSIVGLFAALETVCAVGAWGWLTANVRAKFKFRIRCGRFHANLI